MGESLTEFYPKTQLELVTYKQHNLPLQTQLLYSVQGLSTFNQMDIVVWLYLSLPGLHGYVSSPMSFLQWQRLSQKNRILDLRSFEVFT